MYKIVRYYAPGIDGSSRPNKTIKTGLTLEEAQAHCRDPKTTREGVYFEGYTKSKKEGGDE